jgi:hypothetical protein
MGRDKLGELSVDVNKILKLVLYKYCVTVWTGFGWAKIQSSGELLSTRK